MPRPYGFHHTKAARRCISASLLASYRSGTRKTSAWLPPPAYAALYRDLAKKLGVTEAKRLVLDHVAICERRQHP